MDDVTQGGYYEEANFFSAARIGANSRLRSASVCGCIQNGVAGRQ